MLRAIAVTNEKNDRIDAGKIVDYLRRDFLLECHMATTEIRDRRRTVRYRHLLVRQMVQMKNRISGRLLETGVTHNKKRLHKVNYFRKLLSSNDEITESIWLLLQPAATRWSDYRRRSTPWSVRSSTVLSNPTADDRAGRGSHYSADLGLGDRGCVAVPISEAGDQLLRAVPG
jgi:hypothetical protein